VKVLVTGATGFVGRSVVAQLLEAGNRVTALARDPARASGLFGDGVAVLRGDVLDSDSLAAACTGVDAIIHLAAVIRESGHAQTFSRVNVDGTRNVLNAAAASGVGRVMYASTVGAVDDPHLHYMRSRWLAERLVQDSGIPFSILRFSVAFGEGDEFINPLAAMVKALPIAPVPGDGSARFQPIAVGDAARCLVTALYLDRALGATYDLGGPQYITYHDLMKLAGEAVGSRALLLNTPMPIMKAMVRIMERVMKRPPATSEQLKMLDLDSVAELDSVSRAFGFEPISMQGNLGYVRKMSLWDAIRINLGGMPGHIRDH
jgi:NADH dehydrogenase